MVCRKRCWHRKTECENTDKIADTALKTMKSDLFQKHGRVPAAQKEIMNRNASTSPLLRLPPEIRLRIYKHVLGGQKLWISRLPSETLPHYSPHQIRHHGGGFFHFNNMARSGRGLDIRLLRVCRQIFTETALLPYALNHFTFEKNSVRRALEKLVRPGKKLAQKKAIGQYDVLDWEDFLDVLVAACGCGRKT